jgi:HD-GYP domain-containing protein (c-di-GMP phosphodiesterase class II)
VSPVTEILAVLKKIEIEKLRLGMYIAELCGSWIEHPFWNTKFVLDDASDLERIRDSGIRELWIDVSKGEDVEGGMSAAEVRARNENEVLAASVETQGPAARVSATEELLRARKICGAAKQAVESMFKEARMGRSIDTEALAPLVEEISLSVMRHPGALVSLARLKTRDDYTYMHSVAVCGLMISLARRLGLDEATTREAGLAGLVHDLGKAVVPLTVLNKPDKLTDDEFRVIRGHPGAGHAMLLEGGGAGDIALDVVLHHHEKVDGSGYPHKLKGEQISLFAKMGAVCDVYDAITSNRPYKAGWDPSEALRKMSEWTGHFDTEIFHNFIKCVGIYPLGSLVRLESGMLGVVTETRPDALLKPVVKAFYCTRRKQRFLPRLVDLGKPNARDRIAAWESRDKWRFPDIDEMWTDNRLAVPA